LTSQNPYGESIVSRNGRYVYVFNSTREAFLGTEVVVADSYVPRLVGLLGKSKGWARPGRGLWIIPSRGVHTWGMLFALDLLFLNRERKVIHLEEHVRPFSVSRVCLQAASVLELPVHTIFRTGTRVGDQLEIGPPGKIGRVPVVEAPVASISA
jgi:uncharacterized protein